MHKGNLSLNIITENFKYFHSLDRVNCYVISQVCYLLCFIFIQVLDQGKTWRLWMDYPQEVQALQAASWLTGLLPGQIQDALAKQKVSLLSLVDLLLWQCFSSFHQWRSSLSLSVNKTCWDYSLQACERKRAGSIKVPIQGRAHCCPWTSSLSLISFSWSPFMQNATFVKNVVYCFFVLNSFLKTPYPAVSFTFFLLQKWIFLVSRTHYSS